MPSSSSVLSAAFLADAQALLQAHGLVSDQAAVTDAAAPSAAAAPAKQTKRKREDLVLDAALGEGSWRIDERDEAVEFIERAEGGDSWSCCVSTIVVLSWGTSVHEETGTGTATDADADAAKAAARLQARTSGMKRLARRFAAHLDNEQHNAMNVRLHMQSGGMLPRKKAWRPR